MDVMIVFFGGPLDGHTMTSDSPDALERKKVLGIAQVIGGCVRDAEKREVQFDPGLVYTVPSEQVIEVARRDGWSEAQIRALIPRYEYEYWKVREADGIAEISLRFKGRV